ncbi:MULTISPECIES: hypothetical protein [Arthrobacter]|uniref:hypothetical protein n=1 Tax=Arthrobacter TaxID=1663 RepID=UPI00197AD9DE|nr:MULTISPECIES: hypothetical protein [Arthrobacter]MBT8161787.1 hypothetical protein [Arthrobacter sp. GN70]
MKRLLRLGFINLLAVPVMALAFVSAPAIAAPSPTACSAGTPAPTNAYPGTTVVANNFESGTLDGFTVNTGTTGTATIDNTQAHTGTCSAHLHVTTDPGSLANLVTTLPANSNDVYADAWFNITTVGVAGNDVPYFRFFFDTTRFVDIYRYNSNGQLWLRVTSSTGFNYTELVPGSIPLNAWRHVGMHVIANGAASTIEVWLDGTSVFSSNQVVTTATSVSAVQLGAEHLTQMGDEYIDDLVIKVGGTTSTAAAPGALIPIAPTRFLDTRNSSPVAPDSTVSFQVAGVNGIPANVSAVVFNLTVAEAKSFGFITAYPSGTARPNASNVNFDTGQIVPNLVTVPVGSDGKVTLYNRSAGATQLVADVSGYYLAGTASTPGAFQPIAPTRFLDTRTAAAVPADNSVSFQVGGVNGVPANVSAVVFNLTVAEANSFGFITAYPSGTARPNASNVNFNTGQIVPNLVTVPVGADGKVTLYNRSAGATQLLADVSGYYLNGTPNTPGSFQPMAPARFLDTRTAAAVGTDSTVSFQVGGVNGIPAKVSAVVFNLTVANAASFGFATAYPSGTATPNASNVNFSAGQIVPNLVVVPVGPDGKVMLFNRSSGPTQFIADVAGYYLSGN